MCVFDDLKQHYVTVKRRQFEVFANANRVARKCANLNKALAHFAEIDEKVFCLR